MAKAKETQQKCMRATRTKCDWSILSKINMHIFLDFSMHSKKREKGGWGGFLLSPRIRRKSSVWMDFARGLGRISKVNCFITLPTQHYSFSDPSKRQNFGFMCTFICSRLTMVNSTVLHSKSQPFINITLYISFNVCDWVLFPLVTSQQIKSID